MRFDLSDDEWALLEPLMPKSRKSARADDRKIMTAIFYVLRTGMPWRDLPERYGSTRRRTIGSIAGLDAASGSGFRHARSQIARQSLSDRQHNRESPSRGQRRKRGEQNQAIGISRGGRSTKIHAIVDSKGRPLNFAVTGGQVHDSQVVGDVSPLRPTKPTTAGKSASRSRMKAPCPSSPVAATPPRKPTVPGDSIDGGTKSKTTSAASRTGAASPRATTNSLETSLPPPPSSEHSIGSSCESRP